MSFFALEVLPSQVAVLTFDCPGAKVNTLGGAVLKELREHVQALESRSDVRGLIFRSGKPGQFVAGADLNEIGALAYVTPEQALLGLEAGLGLFQRLSDLPFPTVALIDGPSMGGGTELAISLDERIASNNPKAVIGLPETKLGIIPGWGGTQRMPRLIGIHHAIEMITGGEPFPPKKALETGLVFDVVPTDQLMTAGLAWIEKACETGAWKTTRQKRRQPLALTEDERNFAFGVAEAAIKEKTKGQYPAPLVALAAIRDGAALPLPEAFEVEKKKSLEVMGSPISANLIAIFFMTNKLERDPGVADKSIKPREIKSVGVLGAGLMGSGIATAAARSGFSTVMVDVSEEFVNQGMKRARDVVEKRIQAGKGKPEELADLLQKLRPATEHAAFKDCDVVIEAITEKESLKADTYRQLAPHLKAGSLLASNTSTISISRLAQSSPAPERFAGLHFFNPVDRMPLVEVIRGAATSDETVATLVALAKKLRKTPIVVKDGAGFLVNRILFPYLNEALVLLIEGVAMDAIDQAATRFGMPMGPILLEDVVGLDTSLFAGNVIAAAFPDRAVPLTLLEDLVKAGRLGQKTGSGFRKFTKGTKGEADPDFEPILARHRQGQKTMTEAELQDRLFLPMLFEAVRVLEEGIVREAADVDMGLILGIGFPPFRGGILRWCDREGAAKIVARAKAFEALGKRYQPSALLVKMARTGELFFPRPAQIPTFGV